MGLEHFIARRRTVQAGGLRFVCRGPTVATVHLVLGLYGGEITAARAECDETLDVGELVLAATQALAGVADWRARRVLESCVDGDLEAATATTLIQLAETCCELCDVPQILHYIDMPGDDELPGATVELEDDTSPQSIAICRIARDHGCTPMDVMAWPYEAMCEVLEVYEASTPADGNGEQDVGSVQGIGTSDSRGGGW